MLVPFLRCKKSDLALPTDEVIKQFRQQLVERGLISGFFHAKWPRLLNDDFVGLDRFGCVFIRVLGDISKILVWKLGIKKVERRMSRMDHERLP
jgi:hypothetical protein